MLPHVTLTFWNPWILRGGCVVRGPAASASPGRLQEMRSLGPHSRSTESQWARSRHPTGDLCTHYYERCSDPEKTGRCHGKYTCQHLFRKNGWWTNSHWRDQNSKPTIYKEASDPNAFTTEFCLILKNQTRPLVFQPLQNRELELHSYSNLITMVQNKKTPQLWT